MLSVLNKAGKNSHELEKVIQQYNAKVEDSLKLKAAYFLIANMDIHSSQDIYWVDNEENPIEYNELDYQDFSTAISEFEKIKKKYKQVKPVAVSYKDIDTITATYLIKNIDNAFESWQSRDLKKITFTDFCNYILPYRVGTEPLQDWRQVYSDKFSWINDSVKDNNTEATLKFFADDFEVGL